MEDVFEWGGTIVKTDIHCYFNIPFNPLYLIVRIKENLFVVPPCAPAYQQLGKGCAPLHPYDL